MERNDEKKFFNVTMSRNIDGEHRGGTRLDSGYLATVLHDGPYIMETRLRDFARGKNTPLHFLVHATGICFDLPGQRYIMTEGTSYILYHDELYLPERKKISLLGEDFLNLGDCEIDLEGKLFVIHEKVSMLYLIKNH